jgi:hypothetical protein
MFCKEKTPPQLLVKMPEKGCGGKVRKSSSQRRTFRRLVEKVKKSKFRNEISYTTSDDMPSITQNSTYSGNTAVYDEFKDTQSWFREGMDEPDAVIEFRYQFVVWLYRIRKQFPRMGLFQPDFICITFGKKLLLNSKKTRSDNDIHQAAKLWCNDPIAAELKYGPISL